MSKQKIKKPVEKKADTIKLTNGMIDGFQRNKSIRKLRKERLSIVQRQELYKLSRTIIDSTEAKALRDHLQDMEAERNKTENITPLLITDPEVQALFNLDSGLEVQKVRIPMKLLTTDFTTDDMLITDWIIDFE